MSEESLNSLLSCLKTLLKTKDSQFYSTLAYYQVIRWVKLSKRGAILKLDSRGEICWDLEETKETKL